MDTELPFSQATNDLYAVLSPQLRSELGKIEQSIKIPAGTKLVRHGELLNQLFIVHSGSVRIVISGGMEHLKCDGRGKVFGMRSIMSGETPEESVITEESCLISFIPRADFLALLQAHPQMYFAVARILSNDLLTAQRLLKKSLVPKGKSTLQISVQ